MFKHTFTFVDFKVRIASKINTVMFTVFPELYRCNTTYKHCQVDVQLKTLESHFFCRSGGVTSYRRDHLISEADAIQLGLAQA